MKIKMTLQFTEIVERNNQWPTMWTSRNVYIKTYYDEI